MRRWGFTRMFSLLMTIILGISIFLVWYVGYRGTLAITAGLSNQVRTQLMQTVVFQVSNAFSSALSALEALSFSTHLFAPDFAVLPPVNFTQRAGWMALLTQPSVAIPSLQVVGIFNGVGSVVVLAKSDPTVMSWSAHDQPIVAIVPSVSKSPLTTNDIHLVTPIRGNKSVGTSPSFSSSTADTRFTTNADMLLSDSAADIARYLGPVTSQFAYAEDRARWDVASEIMRRHGVRAFWEEPRLDTYGGVARYTVSAFQRMESAAITVESAPTLMAPLALVTIDSRAFALIFDALSLGDHGAAFLVTQHGKIVAASSPDDEFVQGTGYDYDEPMFVDLSQNTLLPILLGCGLVTDRASTTTLNASGLLRSSSGSADSSCQRYVTWHGRNYLMQARMLDQESTVLPWTVVIFTDDADWYGNQMQTSLVATAITSGLSLGVAIVLSMLISRLLVRRLSFLAGFQQRVRRITAMKSDDSKRRLMLEVQAEWHQYQETTTTSSVASSACSMRCDLRALEVQQIESSFSDLLQTWAGYDELAALNHSKRQFIRYIFHEVRRNDTPLLEQRASKRIHACFSVVLLPLPLSSPLLGESAFQRHGARCGAAAARPGAASRASA
jgi:hypothetical protein